MAKAFSLMLVVLVIATVAGSAGDNKKAAPTTKVVTGLLTNKSGALFVTDEQSQLTFGLRGKSIGQYAGKRVTIRGTVAAGDTEVLQVLEIKPVTSPIAKGAGKPAAAGMKTGLFGGRLYVVGGGAIAVATVSGLYASGAMSSSDRPVSRP